MSELEKLVALSEKATQAIALAEGASDTSFERASAIAAESYFQRTLAKWFRANHCVAKLKGPR